MEIAWLVARGGYLLCDESEENLRVVIRLLVEVKKRKGLKINADKNKAMVLEGEERSLC